MLKIRLATKVLPVRVLGPTLHDLLVGQSVRLIQVVKSGNQTRGNRRAAVLTKRLAPLIIKTLPIDQGRESRQLVAPIDEVVEAVAKQIVGR